MGAHCLSLSQMTSPPPASGAAPAAFAIVRAPEEDKLSAITELRKATVPEPDAGVLVAALYSHKQPGVVEFICSHLARCNVLDIENFIPQLWYASFRFSLSGRIRAPFSYVCPKIFFACPLFQIFWSGGFGLSDFSLLGRCRAPRFCLMALNIVFVLSVMQIPCLNLFSQPNLDVNTFLYFRTATS